MEKCVLKITITLFDITYCPGKSHNFFRLCDPVDVGENTEPI
jgi:hypothetical protein